MMSNLLAKATSEMQKKSDIVAGKLTPNGIPKLDRNFKFPTQLLCESGLTKHSTKIMNTNDETEGPRSFENDWLKKNGDRGNLTQYNHQDKGLSRIPCHYLLFSSFKAYDRDLNRKL